RHAFRHRSSGRLGFWTDLAGAPHCHRPPQDGRASTGEDSGRPALETQMRRTSIVAPLLLIALGTLFLARNLYPDLPLVDYLARFWPFVLIAWGVLRLAEI